MAQSKEKLNTVRNILMLLWSNMGMGTPENIEEIIQFVFNDINKCVDPIKWNSEDVIIAFKHWIEAQAMSDKPEQNDGFERVCTNGLNIPSHQCPSIGDKLNTVGELRNAMSELSDEDQICIETIDTQTGDVEDLYPMYMDVINNIKLRDDTTVNEVRFCQMPNNKPDTRDKQPLVNAVIEDLKKSMALGDYTVLDELLKFIPWEILKGSLPEEMWEQFNSLNENNTNIWGEIRSDFREDDIILYIDAWLTDDDNEEGKVIVKVNVRTKEVEYLDNRARTDSYAQEIIQEYL